MEQNSKDNKLAITRMKALFANAPLSKASKYQMIIRESVEYADENSPASAVCGVRGEVRDQS